jgi:hypothetical protein
MLDPHDPRSSGDSLPIATLAMLNIKLIKVV